MANATCSTTAYPYTLTDGQTADAVQGMADHDCAPIHGRGAWTGNVGVGATTPFDQFEIYNSTNSEIGTVYNLSAGANTSARVELATGTPNSYALSSVYDNSGAHIIR